MSWYEVAFGAHYPLLYAHRDVAEAERAVALLRRLVPLGDGPLLDLACGAGRHLRPLAATGAPVVGLDLSLALLRRARALAPGAAPLVRADMRALPLRGGAATAVLSLFTAFGYFGPLAAHADVLGEVSRVLAPGGHWILDYLNCDAVRRELADRRPRTRRRRLGALAVAETRRLEDDRVVKTVALRPVAEPGARGAGAAAAPADAAAPAEIPREGITYTEEVALFGLAELDALAACHRLARAAAVGDYDGGPLTPASPRWIVAYRREGGAS